VTYGRKVKCIEIKYKNYYKYVIQTVFSLGDGINSEHYNIIIGREFRMSIITILKDIILM